MRNKQQGFAEVVVLYFVIGALALLFIPNPVSKSLGMGIMPNKTVQSTVEKVDLIKDKDGNVIATKTTTAVDDRDIQQHVTFWQWLGSLPILMIILMVAGVIFPPIALILHNLWSSLKTDTKKIVVGVDKALAVVKDDVLKQQMKDEMSKVQDTSTKNLVNQIQGKT